MIMLNCLFVNMFKDFIVIGFIGKLFVVMIVKEWLFIEN